MSDKATQIASLALRLKLITREQLTEATRRIPNLPVTDALVRIGAISADVVKGLEAEISKATAPTAPNAPAVAAGTRFGSYVLQEKLGKGGMGVVYKAWDERKNRHVAVKTMLEHDNPQEIQRFLREASTALELSHPNIIAVFEVDEHEGTPFIAMEYVKGSTFARLLSPRDPSARRTSLKESLRVVRDVARALDHAHSKGIIHRDIKPENVMVDDAGAVKLMDFGLAREIRHGATVTSTGHVMGTPCYMSPEQAQGRKDDIDGRADLWAVGVMLYEIATHRLPFDGETPAEILHKVTFTEPVPPRRVNAAISRDLETLILACLEFEPDRRPASAAVLAADLDSLIAGRPIRTRPAGLLYRWRRRIAKRKALTAAVGAVILAAGLGLVAWRFAKATDAAEGHAAEVSLRGEAYRRLQERLKPLEGLIKETRPFLYAKAVNIREKLDRVAAALQDIEALTREHPDSAELWSLLGIGWYVAGDASRAEKALEKASQLRDDDGLTNFYLARLYLERSMETLLGVDGEPRAMRDARAREWTGRAVKLLQKPVKGWSGADEIDRAASEAYRVLMEGRHADAEARCEAGLKKFGDVAGAEEFWNVLGWCREGDGQIDAYSRAIELRPHYAWAYFRRGNAKLHRRELDGAIADLDRAIAMHPSSPYLRFSRGLAWRLKGDNDRSLEDYAEALRLRPAYAEVRNNRATVHAARGDFERAIEDVTEAIRLRTDYVLAYINLAAIRYSMAMQAADRGDSTGAQALLNHGLDAAEKAVSAGPTYGAAFANRALLRAALGRVDEAAADYDVAARLEPDRVETRFNRSNLRLSKGDWSGALDDLNEALRLAPEFSPALLARASLHVQMGKPDLALKDYDGYLKTQPGDATALAGRSQARLELGDAAGALRDLEEAIRIDPDNVEANAVRGEAFMASGKVDAAIDAFTRALKRSPADVDLLLRRGVCYSRKRDVERSMADLDAALRINTRHVGALMARATLNRNVRRYAAARDDYQKVLEVAPADAPVRAGAEQGLKEMKRQLGE